MELGIVVVALLACGLGIAAVVQKARRSAAERALAQLHAQQAGLQEELARVQAWNQHLSRYQVIADIDGEAVAMRTALAAEVHGTRAALAAELNATREKFAAEAKAAAAAAQAELNGARSSAATQVQAAQQQAQQILAEATGRAEEIGSEALDAKRNVETYRREAQSLKNVIDGYGDAYLVPAHSILDDLAEAFSFAEAGERLKAARAKTRAMIKAGSAATCDYVETNRRETAIAFVIDAFNGKVDSILSTVKTDNVGTLRQKINDAFALVNLNGRAFRDARILDDYRNARLEELRWAAAANELKEQEREEQRRLREQIREEEKARRDYERAMKDAAKEEDAIRKAMERVMKDVDKATEAQRAQYEAQLLELSAKLKAAEEKNQRALSMAQQTRSGHVYVISNVGSFGENVLKIGLTRRLEPADRIRELGDASVPFEFDVHAMIPSEDAPTLERTLHRHFLAAQINKVNPRKEFFRVSLKSVREELEKLGMQVSWTMAAAAEEYRESLAIEAAIRDNPASYEAWVNRQLVLDPVVMDAEEGDAELNPIPMAS